jgi:hypothetical protein
MADHEMADHEMADDEMVDIQAIENQMADIQISDNQNSDIHEPSEQEKDLYYWGLFGQPRLVARSNYPDTTWELRTQEQQILEKYWQPIGEHVIRDKLDNDLRSKIASALDPLEWKVAKTLRIGYRAVEGPPPVVVWVSVEPGSTTWEEGFKVANRVRAELLKVGDLDDVHCEIFHFGVDVNIDWMQRHYFSSNVHPWPPR